MRSVVIAFLVWQCFLHKLACTATESTMTEVTSSGQVFSDVKAASDQKEAVGGKESVHTLADSETSGETPRSEPLVGRGRIAQISSATDVEASTAGHHQHSESNKTKEVDVGPRSIDLSNVRFCIASRNCNSALNERCVSADRRLVCACGQGYSRNKFTKNCELSDGVDGDAVEYEAAWQEHQRLLRGAVDRTDRDDRLDPWRIYGQMSLRDILGNTDESEAVTLEKDRERWLQAELQRIKLETPRELVFHETASNDEILRADELIPAVTPAKSPAKSEIRTGESLKASHEPPLKNPMKPGASTELPRATTMKPIVSTEASLEALSKAGFSSQGLKPPESLAKLEAAVESSPKPKSTIKVSEQL